MTKKEPFETIPSEVLDDIQPLTLAEFCSLCNSTTEDVMEFVEYGIVEPEGNSPEQWYFYGVSVHRVHRAQRLQRHLGVNKAGAALALDLLEELEQVRARLRRLEG